MIAMRKKTRISSVLMEEEARRRRTSNAVIHTPMMIGISKRRFNAMALPTTSAKSVGSGGGRRGG